MNTLLRLLALIKKELHATLSDPKSRKIVVLPVLVEGLILPLAATLEVKNTTLAILNEDAGGASVELVQRLSATSAFTRVVPVHDERAAADIARHAAGCGFMRNPGKAPGFFTVNQSNHGAATACVARRAWSPRRLGRRPRAGSIARKSR